jgi:ectoine hydroxylase-related dioxygenase (phytanoyl-CoA dioxygenase family)
MTQPVTRDFVEKVRRIFDVDGYIVIKNALSEAEVAAVKAAVSRLDLPPQGAVLPLVDKDDAFLDLVDHAKTFPYALALIGGHVQILNTNATVLPAGAPPGGWHEDGPHPPYPAVRGMRALMHLKCGFYIDDLEQDCGNLAVVPGSHQVPFPRQVKNSTLWDMPGATQLIMQAGDAVIFHNGLWHSTAANKTERPRIGVYCTYCPCIHRPHDYVTPPPALMERLATIPQPRQRLLRQLLGAFPEGTPVNYYNPQPEFFPGLKLVEVSDD